MSRLSAVGDIQAQFAQKLEMTGIRGTATFLQMGATPLGRRQLAEMMGVDECLVFDWLNHADMLRIKGVGCEYADLLVAAGVETIDELARQNVDHLMMAMSTVNESYGLVKRLAGRSQVKGWIEQAHRLPRVLIY
jgi:hypothetical protein